MGLVVSMVVLLLVFVLWFCARGHMAWSQVMVRRAARGQGVSGLLAEGDFGM